VIDDARRTSFDRAAARYDAARPSYPRALGELLAARAPGRRLLEIGAGSGKATEIFAAAGFAVTAIEPGANLAAILRAKALANVTIDETTFEAWRGDGDYDVVAAAQSIHWIDPAVRYAKIAAALRAGGLVAIIRNQYELEPDLRAELDAVYARWLPPDPPLDAMRAEYRSDIAASGAFGAVELVELPWIARRSTRDYLELLATYSDHATLPDDDRAALAAAVGDAIDRRGGTIELRYTTFAFVAARR
jgi:SAM-dependent methyltransferase